MVDVNVRHAEPDDAEAIHRVLSGPRATAGTLQLPLQSLDAVRRRFSESPEGLFHLVACVEGEVVGHLGLETFPTRPRRRHVGSIGMAVRDDLQGRGIGSALMEAALDLADNWLGLTRVELSVYVDNVAGVALYRKFGFEVEGTHPRYAFRDGHYVDAHSMARLKPPRH
ncbi:MAG: GNAT family N-acetyltransferase [Chloroflexota bacterium]|jgi:L-phenylalanine/L-methionine N-acetyltransferase|nr:GNAT family N-acetyltransferase [Chloroflexota bacterium]